MEQLKILLLLLCFSVNVPFVFSQNRIQWRTMTEVQELAKAQKRKVMVDVFTDWCGWCKQMDKTTFQNSAIVKFINENYYAVRFNAEHKEDITFKERLYKFNSAGGRKGYHELASDLLKGRMSYPTVVFLDEDLNVIQPIPGYSDAPKFEAIINYFAGDHYKKTPWSTFEKNFKCGSPIPTTIQPAQQAPRGNKMVGNRQ